MDLRLPNLGEGADSGVVVSISVKEGERVEKGQAIIELENEKAIAPIPATAGGVVTKIRVKPGDRIAVGQVILTVDGGSAAPTETARVAPVRSAKNATVKAFVSEPAEEPAELAPGSGLPVAAAPSLRKLARELGIDLSRIRGSETGGRIVLADVRAYLQRLERSATPPKAPAGSVAPPRPVAESVDFSQWGEISKKPMSALRKIISRRMVENWNAIPHVTQFDEADLSTLLELRKKYVAAYEAKGVRLTITSFVLKAVAAVLQKHPLFNASLDEAAQEIVFKEYFHIGIAVDTDAGLIVPVIRDVNKKTLVELSKDLQTVAEKARDRKVSLEDLKGGTFTISNQGGIGGGHFTPIINKPEVAILGLGKGAVKAVVRDKQVVPRTVLPLAISYDHRLIDGGNAARFTVDLVAAIENFAEADVKI